MKIKKLVDDLAVPEGITASVQKGIVKIKGVKGEIFRNFFHPKVAITVEGQKIIFTIEKPSKKEKACLGSIRAHIKNMFKGITEGHRYKVKICSGHFPMTVALKGAEFSVKNLFGEKIARIIKIPKDVSVKIEGNDITLEGINLEVVSQTAANMEKLTVITKRDRRIFQDGLYITEKDGQPLKV